MTSAKSRQLAFNSTKGCSHGSFTKEERMNATTNSADGSDSEKASPAIENDSRIQAIVSAHRDDALRMLVADSPASEILSLRTKNLSAIKSPALPPSALSLLQDLLVKSEGEATRLSQIFRSHRDATLKMLESDAPASRAIALRLESLSAMKSTAVAHPAPTSALQELLGKSEEEAMAAFHARHQGHDAEERNHDGLSGSSKTVTPSRRSDCHISTKVTPSHSPRKREVFREQDAMLKRKEVEKEDNDSGDDAMLRSWQGIFGTRNGTYRVAICYKGKRYFIGTYKLRADAALAYDEASKAIRGPKYGRANHSTKTGHIRMREKEMKSSGLKVDLKETLATISAEVEQLVSDIKAPAELGAWNFDESCSAKEFSVHSSKSAQLEEDDTNFESLKGCYQRSGAKGYKSEICIRGNRLYLGFYKLRSDAAFAYDLAGRALRGPQWDNGNFATLKDHVNMRDKEMRLAGFNIDLKETLATISRNVDKAASNIGTDHNQDGDDCVIDDGGSDSDNHAGCEIPLEDNSSACNSRLCNIANSPPKRNVVGKQDATFQRKEVKNEDNDSGDDEMLKPWKGIVRKYNGNYYAGLFCKGKSYKIGTYKLRADAALAYDEASKVLWGCGKANFSTKTDHNSMREKEMKSSGRKVDLEETLATISAEVDLLVSRIRARSDLAGGDFDESCNEKERSERPSEGAELEHGDAIFKPLKGVVPQPGAKGYYSEIGIRGNRLYLGAYRLQSDAALACDSAGRALGGLMWDKANFKTNNDHADMREKEMRSVGINVDLKESLAAISTNVKKAALKIGVSYSQDGDDCASDDEGASARDNHDGADYESRGETDPPTGEVLRWVSGMPANVQRRHIAAGLRVKVRFENDVWYGGVVEWVHGRRRGRRIKISFDDGTEEMTDFPDNDVIVDDVGNGEHRGDASVFIPVVDTSFDEGCNPRNGSGSSTTEELVGTKLNAGPGESPSISTEPWVKLTDYPSVSSWPSPQPSVSPSERTSESPSITTEPSVQSTARLSVSSLESNICPPDGDVFMGRSSEGSLPSPHADSERMKAAAYEKKDFRVLSGNQMRQPENAAISVEGKTGEFNQEPTRPNRTSPASSSQLPGVSNSPKKRNADQEQAKVSRIRRVLLSTYRWFQND